MINSRLEFQLTIPNVLVKCSSGLTKLIYFVIWFAYICVCLCANQITKQINLIYVYIDIAAFHIKDVEWCFMFVSCFNMTEQNCQCKNKNLNDLQKSRWKDNRHTSAQYLTRLAYALLMTLHLITQSMTWRHNYDAIMLDIVLRITWDKATVCCICNEYATFLILEWHRRGVL